MSLGDEIRKNMTAMSDEEKETCTHCGAVWYKIHYRDGVCQKCQKLNLPGSTLILRQSQRRRAIFIAAAFLAAGIITGIIIGLSGS